MPARSARCRGMVPAGRDPGQGAAIGPVVPRASSPASSAASPSCSSQEVVTRLLDQRLVGVVILLVLGLLVVRRRATGSLVELPTGGRLVRTADLFNLLFLLVVSPLAAILLLTRTASLDPAHGAVPGPCLANAVQFAGLLMYVAGYGLMAWALVRREEDGLRRAFGGQHADYETRVRRLLPFVY